MPTSKPLLCVDFDNTIWDGVLLPGCIEKLTELRQHYRIGIFSARQTEHERCQMNTLLDNLHVPYDEILERKPDAIAFIDDKGVHFQGWEFMCLYCFNHTAHCDYNRNGGICSKTRKS